MPDRLRIRPPRRRGAEHLATFLSIALLVPAGGIARAAEAQLGDEAVLFQDIPSVFAASKFEQSAAEAPSSVTVVTAADIARYGYRTLADLLRGVRGFYATYDRNYTYVGTRGFGRPGDYNTRILLLIDGHRVNDCVTDFAYFGTESLVDMTLVERVEVIRGASSSLYGTNAFLAVINVVTRGGGDLDGGEVSAAGGKYGTYDGRISYGSRTASGFEFLLSAAAYHSRGQDHYYAEFDDPATNFGNAVGIDDDERIQAFAKLAWGRHHVELNVNNREKSVPTAAWETLFNDPRLNTRDRTGYLAWHYDAPAGREGRVSLSASYDDSLYEGDYPYEDGLMWDEASGRWWTGEARLLQPLGAKHRMTVGVEYRYNALQHQGTGYVGAASPVFVDSRNSQNWALYAQDEWRISERLIVNAGVRQDHYETFGGTTNPRLAVIVKPDRRSALKLLYGDAFRAPNAYELYYHDDGLTQKAPVALEPETIRSYEISYERTGAGGVTAGVSVYRYDIAELVSLTTDPSDDLLVFANIDRVQAQGVELELSGALGAGVDVRASYAYQGARDERTGQILSNSPRHLATLGLGTRVLRDLARLGLEANYVGPRITTQGGEVGGFVTTNLVLNADFAPRMPQLTVGLYNLLDRDYADPGGEEHVQNALPQDGRTYRVALTAGF